MPKLPVAVALALSLSACSTSSFVPSDVCAEINGLPKAVTLALDAVDPHSALGVLWADVKAGCVGTTAKTGVSIDWLGIVVGELKVLAPQVIPWLAGML